MTANIAKTTVYPIPDLRFEQSFFRSLQTYANKKAGINHTLSEKELKLMGVDESAEDLNVEGNTLQAPVAPLAPITPSVVAYAVIKDQIILPLLQGFLWSGFLLCLGPVMRAIVANGQTCGTWLAQMVGLGRKPVYGRGFTTT
ncbi:hypothetical protein EJF18_10903 [Clavispora lusitaniae]|uniref:Uncharacterized protein n=2 Tax=Clavispora lusitaniae TaxID=36911 RepID=C4XY53_CLAL4|nr:uncharacterized protein CLUG_00876 [Clavispora lusitaniae ATCC 42720]KAF5212791.1 hypothetical protein E0198_000295 [Clavispora lusitaniae]EEQ36753.1 hypothetical protein CLUG_00876 [Clavispora lusitaniae ATCC 42720]KAF7584753.1 hypothetical protein FOB63_000825 [Clavispora lusitaniae]QFZ25791.1 hypothetical protein EJF14_10903 [Clavispora lusitaniae]QFZ30906.1 hypothetical protein EJF16_10903 [Clavispora lusitaniae]